jgi:branched-chain amino acid aminotransferase
VREADLDLYDAYNADEVFLTSTSLCICPVTKVNGVAIGPAGQVWGPVTRRIADGYQRFVGHDFVGQYLQALRRGHGRAGILTAPLSSRTRESATHIPRHRWIRLRPRSRE